MWQKIWYSFPVQLLFLHVKKNQWLLLLWLLLFSIVLGKIGTIFGIPYLFLDPEYNHQVSLSGLFILGIALGGFTMAFHIACYILDAHRFGFLGNETNPFTKFCVNNSTIPLAFLVTYLICYIRFQFTNEFAIIADILLEAFGLLTGFGLTVTLLFYYFISTNKDIFKVLASNVNHQLRRKKKVNRVNVMKKVDQVQKNRIRVDYFFTGRLTFKAAKNQLIDLTAALKVLKQNHQNAFIIQCFVFVLIILLGIFRDKPGFQIPASASILLLFTLAVLFAGAIAFWSGRWAVTVFIGFVLILNYLVKNDLIQSDYEAFGLNYTTPKADYSMRTIKMLSNDATIRKDMNATLGILRNWKNKFPEKEKPKLVFVCTSGGGQRAAVWTMRSLQMADSLLQGKLMKHTFLMTGASGGLLGASYFRELYLRQQQGEIQHIYDERYMHNIAKDNLNAIAFSLVVSDLLFKFQTFTYCGQRYYKDRGYAFEQQFSENTGGILDKSLLAYREPEKQAQVPMLIMSPTVINDGRKLYISPQHISYMTTHGVGQKQALKRYKGIEFLRMFEAQGAQDLRFLSALRMSATFPYITPTVVLPSQPEMEVMDSGLSDNYGISDAVHFLYVFQEWIKENTSGVVFLVIRDTPKEQGIEQNASPSLFNKIFTPIGSLYNNWNNMQDINNDNSLQFANEWFDGRIDVVELKYAPQSGFQWPINTLTSASSDSLQAKKLERASLSWHLTERERNSLRLTIYQPSNQTAIRRLSRLLE